MGLLSRNREGIAGLAEDEVRKTAKMRRETEARRRINPRAPPREAFKAQKVRGSRSPSKGCTQSGTQLDAAKPLTD